MILVGELALWVALLMAAWASIVLLAGARGERPELVASGDRAVHALFICLVLATAGLVVALVTSDVSLAYVASFTSANLPAVYKLAALWAGPAGALLLWTLILSTLAMSVAVSSGPHRPWIPYAAGTLAIVLSVLLTLLCLEANPFQRLTSIPVDGRGMDPELQHPAMVVHPPALYLGYAATTIPFAFTVGALAARKLDDEWAQSVMRWGTVSWFFLTIGMIAGMWWAYVEPARNRDWAWEPVVSFAFFPWLTISAVIFLGMRKPALRWAGAGNVMLVAATFFFALTAAFITQQGIVASLQGSPPSAVGKGMAVFLVAAIVATGFLITIRHRDLALPRIAGRGRGNGRARAGRVFVRAGALLFVVGLIGLTFRKEHDVSLSPGEAATLVDSFGEQWTFASQGVSDFAQPNRGVEAVALRATREGAAAKLIRTERRQYIDSRGVPTSEPSTEAGIHHSLLQDTYVVVIGVTGDRAQLRIAFNPFVTWVWIGGSAIAFGGMLIAWPVTSPRQHGAA